LSISQKQSILKIWTKSVQNFSYSAHTNKLSNNTAHFHSAAVGANKRIKRNSPKTSECIPLRTISPWKEGVHQIRNQSRETNG